LTSDSYIPGLELLKQQRKVAVQEKKRKKIERDEIILFFLKAKEREYKAIEREAKALEREREQRALEKQQQVVECVEKKVQKAIERKEAQRIWMHVATEWATAGGQGGRRNARRG
jgi:hypothetical protein